MLLIFWETFCSFHFLVGIYFEVWLQCIIFEFLSLADLHNDSVLIFSL